MTSLPTSPLLRWIDSWIANVPKTPEIIVVRGDGPHVDALRAHWPGTLLVALDRNPSRSTEELTLIENEPALFQARVRRALVARLDLWRCAPPDNVLAAVPCEADFQAAITSALEQAELEHGTVRTLGPLWLANLLRNLPTIAEVATIQRAGLAWRGSPVLVAGAGPSLATIIPGLQQHRERTVVLAASSALRPLFKHGIVPDAVAIIEARDCTHHFDGIPLDVMQRIVLLAASHTHPTHWTWPWAARVAFHGPVGAWLVPWTGKGTLLPTAGNVGTTMLVMAWMLGGYPVMAAGLDFALEGGQYYATGAGSRVEEHQAQARSKVSGWRGESLEATAELIAYRQGTELALQQIVRGDPSARFLSITGRGAKVHGMQFAPWAKLAPELPLAMRGGLRRAASVPECLPPPPDTVNDLVQAQLAQVEADLRAFQQHRGGVGLGVTSSHGHSGLSELLVNIARQPDESEPDGDPLTLVRRLREAWSGIATLTTTSV